MSRCQTCGRNPKRSTEANRRYWLLLGRIAEKVKPEETQYSAETWHTYFKLRFIGGDDIKMPNGKVIVMPKSSAELDKTEFHEYAYLVEEWAGERGVYLDEIADEPA
jgi:hypothetical protein